MARGLNCWRKRCYNLTMKYIATIEIPRNSDRRIHKDYHEWKFIDFGLISEKITANGGRMPLAYGFINDTASETVERDETDVMIFSTSDFETGDSVEVVPFAMMVRADGDYKVLAHDNTISYTSFDEIPADMQKTLMDFNGFKLPIIEIKNAEDSIAYIESVKI